MKYEGRPLILFVIISTFIISSSHFIVLVDGDGGFIPAIRIDVYEPGQKAILCFNGSVERMTLSVDIHGDEMTEGFHVIPFPSTPNIEIGDIEVFKNLSRLIYYGDFLLENNTESHDKGDSEYSGGGSSIVIEFHETIGEHDVAVIKVNDPEGFRSEIDTLLDDLEMEIEFWPEELNDIIESYCNRNITHFSLDHYSIDNETKSIQPLIYEFKTDSVYFPLEISSMLEGYSNISLAIVVPEDLPLDLTSLSEYDLDFYMEDRLDEDDRERLDKGVGDLFQGNATLFFMQWAAYLPTLNGDLSLPLVNDHVWFQGITTENGYFMADNDEIVKDPVRDRFLFINSYSKFSKDRIYSFDMHTGEIIWEVNISADIRKDYEDDYGFGRDFTLFDTDRDGEDELVVVDVERDHQISVSIVEIENGELISQTTCFVSHWRGGSFRFMYPIGSDNDPDLLLVHHDGFVLMDLSNGEYIGQWSEYKAAINYDDLFFVNFPKGDAVVYEYKGETYCRGLYPLSRETDNPYIRTYYDPIWKLEWSIWGHWKEGLSGYGYGVKDVYTNGNYDFYFTVIDLLDGSEISSSSGRGYLSNYKYISSSEITNGQGDWYVVAFLHFYNYNPKILPKIICLDPFSGEDIWTVDPDIELDLYRFSTQIADINGDGWEDIGFISGNIYSKYQSSLGMIISGQNGGVFLTSDDPYYLEMDYDWDGDGVDEALFMEMSGILTVLDPDGDVYVRMIEGHAERYRETVMIDDFDKDGKDDLLFMSGGGKKELVLIKMMGNDKPEEIHTTFGRFQWVERWENVDEEGFVMCVGNRMFPVQPGYIPPSEHDDEKIENENEEDVTIEDPGETEQEDIKVINIDLPDPDEEEYPLEDLMEIWIREMDIRDPIINNQEEIEEEEEEPPFPNESENDEVIVKEESFRQPIMELFGVSVLTTLFLFVIFVHRKKR